jgi:hypothetical protein
MRITCPGQCKKSMRVYLNCGTNICNGMKTKPSYLAVLDCLLRSLSNRNTRAYEEMQNSLIDEPSLCAARDKLTRSGRYSSTHRSIGPDSDSPSTRYPSRTRSIGIQQSHPGCQCSQWPAGGSWTCRLRKFDRRAGRILRIRSRCIGR